MIPTTARRAGEASKYSDPMILDTVALAYFRKGDTARAIELQQKALDLMDKAGTPAADPGRKEMADRLAVYRGKKGQ